MRQCLTRLGSPDASDRAGTLSYLSVNALWRGRSGAHSISSDLESIGDYGAAASMGGTWEFSLASGLPLSSCA